MVDVLRVPIIFKVLMVGVDCNGVLGAYVSRIALAHLKTQLYKTCKSMHTRSQKKEKPSKPKNGQKTTTLLAD